MQKQSIVWSIGCLFISLLLILPPTSLADDKKETKNEEIKSTCDGKQESPEERYKALQTGCDQEEKSPKTCCDKFESEFKPKLSDTSNLFFKDLYLKFKGGYTNTTGTSGMFGQFGIAAKVDKTPQYGMGFGYKDKPIVSHIMKFFPQNPGKYTWEKDLLLDPIKLTAEFSYGKTLLITFDPEKGEDVDKYPIKTTYNIEISYTLPIDILIYHTGIGMFRPSPSGAKKK